MLVSTPTLTIETLNKLTIILQRKRSSSIPPGAAIDVLAKHQTFKTDLSSGGPTSLPISNVFPHKLNNFSTDNLEFLATADESNGSKSRNSEIPDSIRPINRANDEVYCATTAVVKSIMVLSQGVEKSHIDGYLHLVKNVGVELRNLLKSVDKISILFPAQALK